MNERQNRQRGKERKGKGKKLNREK